MNANELADELEAFHVDPDGFPYMVGEAVTMLRQQQAEIESLKKSCLDEIIKRTYADRSAEVMCEYWQEAEEKVKFLEDKAIIVQTPNVPERMNEILRELIDKAEVRSSPPHIVDSGASVQLYKDLEFPGFNLRFTKQGDEWVCKMPDWLLDQAIVMTSGLFHRKNNVQK